jgi:beta-glucosidase
MNGKAIVRLGNTGTRKGATVAQLYAFDGNSGRPIPQLVGFARVDLSAGESAEVEVDLDLTPVHERSPETKRWTRRPGEWHLVAAHVSPDRAAIARALAEGAALPLASSATELAKGVEHAQ